jgi:hypothetical protein
VKQGLHAALATIVLLGVWGGCESAGPTAAPSAGAATGGKPTTDEEIWAIRCITLQGPERFAQAEAYAAALKKVPGLKPALVQVISDDDGTALFYGHYKRVYGPTGPTDKFTPDHLRDMEAVRALRVQSADVWPFILASMDILPTYRSAHPEWDLNNADGYWSLHVAVFYNTDTMRSRRAAAEEYCAVLRQQGEPAYFHHGAANSSVYVGLYPFEAVVDVRQDEPLTGRVATSRRIVDPQMLAAQQRFPISLHNLHTMYDVFRDTQGNVRDRVPQPSFPVIVPRAAHQEAARPAKGR